MKNKEGQVAQHVTHKYEVRSFQVFQVLCCHGCEKINFKYLSMSYESKRFVIKLQQSLLFRDINALNSNANCKFRLKFTIYFVFSLSTCYQLLFILCLVPRPLSVFIGQSVLGHVVRAKKRGFPRSFVSDTSPKRVDLVVLEEIRTGTGQVYDLVSGLQQRMRNTQNRDISSTHGFKGLW